MSLNTSSLHTPILFSPEHQHLQAASAKKHGLGAYQYGWDWRSSYIYQKAAFSAPGAQNHFYKNLKKLVDYPVCPQCGSWLKSNQPWCKNSKCVLFKQVPYQMETNQGSNPHPVALNLLVPTLKFADWAVFLKEVVETSYPWETNPLNAYYYLFWDVHILIELAKQMGIKYLPNTNYVALWNGLLKTCQGWLEGLDIEVLELLAYQNGFFMPTLAEKVEGGKTLLALYLNPAMNLEKRRAMRFAFQPIWDYLKGEMFPWLYAGGFPPVTTAQQYQASLEKNLFSELERLHLSPAPVKQRYKDLAEEPEPEEAAFLLVGLLPQPEFHNRYAISWKEGKPELTVIPQEGAVSLDGEFLNGLLERVRENLLGKYAPWEANHLDLIDTLEKYSHHLYGLYQQYKQDFPASWVDEEALAGFVHPEFAFTLGLLFSDLASDVIHLGACANFIKGLWEKAKLYQSIQSEGGEDAPLLTPWHNLIGLKAAQDEYTGKIVTWLGEHVNPFAASDLLSMLTPCIPISEEAVAAYLPDIASAVAEGLDNPLYLKGSAAAYHQFITQGMDGERLLETCLEQAALDCYQPYLNDESSAAVLSNPKGEMWLYYQQEDGVFLVKDGAQPAKSPFPTVKDAARHQMLHGGLSVHCPKCGAARKGGCCARCGNTELFHQGSAFAQKAGTYALTPLPLIPIYVQDGGYFGSHIARLAKYVKSSRGLALPMFASLEGLTFRYVDQAHLSGVHEKWILEDEQEGRKWLFKPDKHLKGLRAYVESFAAWVFNTAGVYAPPTFVLNFNKRTGSIQPLLSEVQTLPPDPQAWTQEQVQDVLAAQVLRWLISDHDGQYTNYLDAGGRAVAIDMGQAFRYFGEDRLALDYHPNASYGAYEPISNILWRAIAKGKIAFQAAWLLPVLAGVEAIDDALYAKELEKIAKKGVKVKEVPWKDTFRAQIAAEKGVQPSEVGDALVVERFVSLALARKQNLREEYTAFVANALKDKQFKLA